MYEYKVLDIVSIYDGDTMKVILDLGFSITSRQNTKIIWDKCSGDARQ